MTNQNDPIEEIKKAEALGKRKIEQAAKDFEEKTRKHSEELEGKLKTFEDDLREKGMKKLETAKGEASELFKSKMATTESEKAKLIQDANGKMGEATKEIISAFLEHVK